MTDVTEEPQVAADARDRARNALLTLLEGNRRFADGAPTPHVLTADQRTALLPAQDPMAIVLGCVDARVPPEVVLDQGVGDLFTVRTAGHSLAGVALGSLEFGVRKLGVPLLVVMAHTGCGAVLAALANDPVDGHLGELTGEVAGRLARVVGSDPVRATGANLEATVEALRALHTMVTPDGDEAFVVGLLYDMATGLVEVVDDAGLLID